MNFYCLASDNIFESIIEVDVKRSKINSIFASNENQVCKYGFFLIK
jgi:hypothetical protein